MPELERLCHAVRADCYPHGVISVYQKEEKANLFSANSCCSFLEGLFSPMNGKLVTAGISSIKPIVGGLELDLEATFKPEFWRNGSNFGWNGPFLRLVSLAMRHAPFWLARPRLARPCFFLRGWRPPVGPGGGRPGVRGGCNPSVPD